MSRALIYDTETTDLVANSLLTERHQPHLIEFYGCVIDEKGELLEELDFLCRPPNKIEPKTTEITGIKWSDIHDLPPFSAHADKVAKLIEECDTVVAHNLSYDRFVIDVEMQRLGRSICWPGSLVCTVEATTWVKGFRLNLSALYTELFGEEFKGAHRAKNDVRALTRCFVELRQRGWV